LTEELETVVQYRLSRASETLDEARLLADAGHWNGCVSRLYYSCFYAVTALLLRHGLSSSKHSGVRAMFNRDFVQPGVVSRELGELYNRLFRTRNRGDYDDFVQFDEASVRPQISRVAAFISEVGALAASPSDSSGGSEEDGDG
jgi:uncharacterized protein (UPF0332 family)